MKTLFLLIILTRNGAGDINAAFVNTETLSQCQQKAAMLAAVFQTADIPVLESRCVRSAIQFSKFGHVTADNMRRNFYLVSLESESVQISIMPDWHTCIEQEKSVAAKLEKLQGRVYCSSSVQSML